MIQLDGIRLRRGTRVILDEARLTLHPGEKVGLVGRNGAGKSSLFALLAGRLQEDQGEWSMPKTWRISEVLQQLDDEPVSATEFVLQGDQVLAKARADLQAAHASEDGMAMATAKEWAEAKGFGAEALGLQTLGKLARFIGTE